MNLTTNVRHLEKSTTTTTATATATKSNHNNNPECDRHIMMRHQHHFNKAQVLFSHMVLLRPPIKAHPRDPYYLHELKKNIARCSSWTGLLNGLFPPLPPDIKFVIGSNGNSWFHFTDWNIPKTQKLGNEQSRYNHINPRRTQQRLPVFNIDKQDDSLSASSGVHDITSEHIDLLRRFYQRWHSGFQNINEMPCYV